MTRWFREVGDASLFPAGSVVAIGAFDGVHRGHQCLLAMARARAEAGAHASVALSFEPLPREYFAPQSPPPRLTPARTRFELLRGLGMDGVGLLRFDPALAGMDAGDFVERILVRGLSARTVCVGPDFRFGRGRGGDVALLQRMGSTLGFETLVAAQVDDAQGRRIGASAIRGALQRGDLDFAKEALGRRYAIAGKVMHGNRLGRTLGFPTANIAIRWRPAVEGIFAVRVSGAGLLGHPGVASLGTRPTVAGDGSLVLESHLFDYAGDLYGQRLIVEFVARLRGEARFDSLDALTTQMHEDARQARAVLARPD
ncbi:bifunctional riboflavin kinase/FAD synthetase [Pseudofulvimonas gallinarii]|uniref:Riboflavin biosynthesis protein n=1 Tax=Pseudofulvimonas gallinarii TaxID=634155 RepID=A0A4S3KWT9_9GAMM|nr:bifunctional riboflavin kinase/FAD synthetase [Pseudofulvimonas gallinarii]TCT00170.1 FMN adenylyltransferase /riboflavin kinase [Pseudofulvimonas gallinarii]THD13636.1 riboflavin biosynthesis protein RibF [Pseudofulvimonas gallinarii]